MSLATSMKNLIEDIQTSTNERHVFVKSITKNVKELIVRFDNELKEMAAEVKKFLFDSEKLRKEEFVPMMEDIRKWQKNVRKDAVALVKEYASDSGKAKEYWLSFSKQGKKSEHTKKETVE